MYRTQRVVLDNPGFTEGTNGILTGSDGNTFDLGSLRPQITRQVCDRVLPQGTLLQVATQASVHYTAISIDRSHAPSSLPRNFMLETAALVVRPSQTSGFRLYLAVFAAGVLGCMGWLHSPLGLQMLESWWMVGLAGVLAVAEFLADKIPGFDSVWDDIQTFIRVPVGAIPAVVVFEQFGPQRTVATGLIGGAPVGTTYVTKTGTCALINTLPEPFSNWVTSSSKDVAASSGLLMAFFLPIAFLVVLALLLLVSVWLLSKPWRGARQLRDTLRRRSPGSQSPDIARLSH